MNSKLLQGLYRKYEVANLSGGKLTDALGDVYEEFVQIIFLFLPIEGTSFTIVATSNSATVTFLALLCLTETLISTVSLT